MRMRDAYPMPRDVDRKLDTLRVECRKCGRAGRYHVAKLIARYGLDGLIITWVH